MRILHVEDDKPLADAVRLTLLHHGHECKTTPDGAKGWKLFSNNPKAWDIVILDLQLPTCPGEWLLNAMHKLSPNTPILILTKVDLDKALHLYQLGAAMLLAKPFKMEDLIETLEVMVNYRPLAIV